MLQAVIFDFDGVISDTEPLHLKAFNEVLAQFDIEIAPHDYYIQYLALRTLTVSRPCPKDISLVLTAPRLKN